MCEYSLCAGFVMDGRGQLKSSRNAKVLCESDRSVWRCELTLQVLQQICKGSEAAFVFFLFARLRAHCGAFVLRFVVISARERHACARDVNIEDTCGND